MGCYSLREAFGYWPPNTQFRKRRRVNVSIFDRFVSKAASPQGKKPSPPTPYRRLFSELEAAGEEAMELYPDDGKTISDFVWELKEACQSRRKRALEGDPQPMGAEARFFLSEDRMSAYACVLPPENGGDGLALEAFLESMHYEGINYGILQEEIQRAFGLGYLRIFPVARGKPLQAGEDGKVIELFQRRKNMSLEIQNGSQVEFRRDMPLQPIRKGAVICLIRRPKAGADGMDVTGRVLPCPQAADAYVPQGENTAIGRGGQALMASVDGILYIENDQFCIHEQKIMDGGLDSFQGTLQISGNLYIEGNVDGGANVEASGDIVINGKMGQGRVRSLEGTILVQQGIYGTQGKTFLSAARQVQSPVVERADVDAGTSVIAEMISNSTIRCDGTVYAMTGRGMIIGSLIRAGDSILCLRVGNLAGERSRFSVGYPPHSPESWNQAKTELAEVQATIKKLWDTVAGLRKKGTRISDAEKLVLDQLVEQRDLYIEKREALTAELAALDKLLDKKSKGRIRCEQLHPCLDVQIGKLAEEITTAEENCSIHAEDNRILLK